MQATPGAPLNAGDTHAADDGRVSAPRRIRLFVSVALTVYALDVGSKIVAVDQLGERPPVELLGGLLTLRLTTNAGAAFSIGTDLTLFLSLIAVAVVLGVVWVARRVGSPLWALSLGLLLGGAAGNLTDRLLRDPAPLRGHVVDFLELPYWPIFNLADSAIVVAAGLIVLQSLRGVAVDGTKAET